MNDACEFERLKGNISNFVHNNLKSTLSSKVFNESAVGDWINEIGSQVLRDLQKESPNFKYIVSTIILRNPISSLHSDVSSLWDATTDGAVIIKYENNDITCLCTVIGVAM